MKNIALVRNFALASLFVVPACVDTVDDDGDLSEVEGAAETAALMASACPPNTPAALAPAIDQDLAFVFDATGVQKYACNATATGAAWTLVAPDALLLDAGGTVIGTHYAGPTWEYKDGSTVVGARVAGVTVDASAIPWLLLSTPSHGGPDGKLTDVTAIQRLVTGGGIAPAAASCDASHLGAATDVAYTAKYFFYRTRSRHTEGNTRCGAL